MINYNLYLDDQHVLSPSIGTTASICAHATNMASAGGAYRWCVAIPTSLSAHPDLYVQVNYSNYYMQGQSIVSPIRYGMTVPLPATYPHEVENPSFSANWITIDTITAGQIYYYTDKPARFIRLSGTGVADYASSATQINFGSDNFFAYFWTSAHVMGI